MADEKSETTEGIQYPLIIKLKDSITDEEGNELKELIITKRPTGAAFLAFPMENQKTLDFLVVAQKITNVPLPILKKMSVYDTMKVVSKVSDFFD